MEVEKLKKGDVVSIAIIDTALGDFLILENDKEKCQIRGRWFCEPSMCYSSQHQLKFGEEMEFHYDDVAYIRHTKENFVSVDGKYIIPVSWRVYSTITVEADNLAQALEIAKNKEDEIPICREAEYIDGTYKVDIESYQEALDAQGYVKIGNVTLRKNGRISY